jgi:DNA-binding CsgD family transcriptional regulator
MSDAARLLGLVGQLYESVLDDHALPNALASLADYSGASAACYVTADAHTGGVLSADLINYDPDYQRRYVAHYGRKDLRIPPTLIVPVGEPITEHRFVDRETFERSEIYNDFLVPADIPHIMAVWVAKSTDSLAAVSLQRSLRQGRFLVEDEQRYKIVIPHLIRALRLRNELTALRAQLAHAMDVVDHLPFGVVFLDRAGRILHASHAATALMSAGNAIVCRDGAIRALDSADDQRLSRAIFRTCEADSSNDIPGDTILVRAAAPGRPITIAVLPLSVPPPLGPSHARCLLVVLNPDAAHLGAAELVERLLKLTRSEARLACALSGGVRLKDAAEQLAVSVNTCKAQLKSIYAKTGCKSHVDLARAVWFATAAGARKDSK